MTGWERLGIGGLSQGFLSGRLSPSAALEDAPAGIASINDDLSAFVAIDADGARRASAAADAELKRGRWRGPQSRVGTINPALTGPRGCIRRTVAASYRIGDLRLRECRCP
jgi:hypothetical protein